MWPCKFKATSLTALDMHILSFHKIDSDKNVDIRNLEGRSICNFTDPSHSNECCDREPGQPQKLFTPNERLQKGPFRSGNESFFWTLQIARIPVCSFQEYCRNPEGQRCRAQEQKRELLRNISLFKPAEEIEAEEILVVNKANLGKRKERFINGYGPQETDNEEIRKGVYFQDLILN